MNYGFTGTRRGMSAIQKEALIEILDGAGKEGVFAHGDCIGSDEEADKIARYAGLSIDVHPPTDDKARAFCKSDTKRKPKPYLERNKCVVNVSYILIAAPESLTEEVRSGTWATIRYARKFGIPVVILDP